MDECPYTDPTQENGCEDLDLEPIDAWADYKAWRLQEDIREWEWLKGIR